MTNAPGRRFLLVSDATEKQMQWSRLLRNALCRLGKLCITTGKEAVEEVSRESYDMIIVDSGAVHKVALLVSRLRAQRPESRVLVVTASPSWQAAREVLKAGAIDYLSKSLSGDELRSRIEVMLRIPQPESAAKEYTEQ